MATNTRLKESDRTETIKSLNQILDRVVQSIEMPIQDKAKWANAWNSKIPQMLFTAMDVCRDYGYEAHHYEADPMRFVVHREGKFYSAPIKIRGGEEPPRPPLHISHELRGKIVGINVDVKRFDGASYTEFPAMLLTDAELREHFGEEGTELFMDWIVSTSALRVELKEARQTIDDIFAMAKTAGQIKRMVPDLLQYLPVALRRAYENQIRASSLPFEWAPYPRDRVERMIVAVGKGHLLHGMAKDSQRHWTVQQIDNLMWGAEVKLSGEAT